MVYLLDFNNVRNIYKKSNSVISINKYKEFINYVKEIKEISPSNIYLHIQVFSKNCKTTLKLVKSINKDLENPFYIKVDDNKDSKIVIKELKKEKITFNIGYIFEKNLIKEEDFVVVKFLFINNENKIRKEEFQKIINGKLINYKSIINAIDILDKEKEMNGKYF